MENREIAIIELPYIITFLFEYLELDTEFAKQEILEELIHLMKQMIFVCDGEINYDDLLGLIKKHNTRVYYALMTENKSTEELVNLLNSSINWLMQNLVAYGLFEKVMYVTKVTHSEFNLEIFNKI